MALHGIADRLFGLGKAKARHASRGLDLGSLTGRLEPAERQAVERARNAAARCRKVLHGDGLTSPELLDEVGGEVDALADAVVQLAERIAKARLWLHQHDPETLAREAAEAELDEALGFGSAVLHRQSQAALNRQADVAREVEQGIPLLSLRLLTASREIEALEARVTGGVVSGVSGVDGLLEGLRTQRDKAQRALENWAATVRELGGLG